MGNSESDALGAAIKNLQEKDPEKYEALMKRAEEENHEEDSYWVQDSLYGKGSTVDEASEDPPELIDDYR